MAKQIDLPLETITLTFGNVHIYENNIENTKRLLNGEEGIRFELNVCQAKLLNLQSSNLNF